MNFFFDKIFPVIFVLMFVFVVVGLATGVYVSYECYRSNDPKSVACFMATGNQQVLTLEQK